MQSGFKVMWQPLAADSLTYWALVGDDVETDCAVSVGEMCLHPLCSGDTTFVCE